MGDTLGVHTVVLAACQAEGELQVQRHEATIVYPVFFKEKPQGEAVSARVFHADDRSLETDAFPLQPREDAREAFAVVGELTVVGSIRTVLA